MSFFPPDYFPARYFAPSYFGAGASPASPIGAGLMLHGFGTRSIVLGSFGPTSAPVVGLAYANGLLLNGFATRNRVLGGFGPLPSRVPNPEPVDVSGATIETEDYSGSTITRR